MIDKINRLKNCQVAVIIAVIGFAVYFSGLTTPFQGDDLTQIVNNVPVHSISNIKLFFDGGTFYYGNNGSGVGPLVGSYYRPLMTTTFSVLYTLFGAHSIYFHLFQLFVVIGCAMLLYLFFLYSFKPALALILSLIFLVHPFNSQTAFAIPSMQDVLFFFFGILALYILVRLKSVKSLALVAVCLFLSLLAKESAVLFISMSILYLFWWDSKKRLLSFISIMILPTLIWFVLRFHAIGLDAKPAVAPIDSLNLLGRLMTAPSIMLFYLEKFIFPWKLASGYYWVHPNFSLRYVLLPLIIGLAIIGLAIYTTYLLHKKATRAQFYTYLYFLIWSALGLIILLQIVPLDRTACDSWFYFPCAGVLGMIGVVLESFEFHIRPEIFIIFAFILIVGLGIRTAIRGRDWSSPYKLAFQDVSASKDDFDAMNEVSYYYINQEDYSDALTYAQESVAIYPFLPNEQNLGVSLMGMGDYSSAVTAFNNALKYAQNSGIYNNLAALTLLCGSKSSNQQFFQKAFNKYPYDSTLWTYYALFEDENKDNSSAKEAITNAATYGSVSSYIYHQIINNQPLTLALQGKTLNIN